LLQCGNKTIFKIRLKYNEIDCQRNFNDNHECNDNGILEKRKSHFEKTENEKENHYTGEK